MLKTALLCAAALTLVAVEAHGQVETNKQLANRVKEVFLRSCYGCHGEPGSPAKAGLNILNYEQLIGEGLVIEGASTFSQLFDFVESGEMPPAGEKFPNGETPQKLSSDEVKLIENWIDGGAEPWDEQGNGSQFITYASLLDQISNDMSGMPSSERGITRYLSFAHLYNRGLSDKEVERYRKATIKLLNSLSTKQQIYIPEYLDDKQNLMKLDISKMDWHPRTWRRLEREYPFGKNKLGPLEDSITNKLVTENAFLKADWFVATASRPPLYHEIIYTDLFNIGGAAKGILERIEFELGVDRIENILSGRAIRGGFNSSGVSVNNRIIERHDIGDYPGAYWISYDFAGNSADPDKRQNIFNFPLGPSEAFPALDETFLHDGGEVIFNLPNGLQAYLLTDAKGNRLDKGPTNIVTDPIRPDNAVENGLSCFRCHDKGMILKRDTIRNFIELNKDLYGGDFPVLAETYQGNDIFYEKQKQDLNDYLSSLNQMKVSIKEKEPISTTALEFEKDMDLSMVASELYTREEELLEIISQSQVLKAIIGPASVGGGRIKRDYFLENYKTIEKEINY